MSRLSTLLEKLASKGFSQARVAEVVGLTPQFLSDIKCGRRPLTDAIARRLSEHFQVNVGWLMASDAGSLTGGVFGPLPESGLWLPVFPHPVEGEPRLHPAWDGSFVHVPAIAGPKLVSALHPYVLRYRNSDVDRRLYRNDRVLISQSPNETAQIVVVRERRRCFLARRKGPNWIRLANGKSLATDSVVVGHCLGVLWSALD